MLEHETYQGNLKVRGPEWLLNTILVKHDFIDVFRMSMSVRSSISTSSLFP